MKPAAFWALAPLTLLGASLGAQPVAELPEVRVSSGLIEQRQFDAPGSVQALDAERIRASGPQVNLSDVRSEEHTLNSSHTIQSRMPSSA